MLVYTVRNTDDLIDSRSPNSYSHSIVNLVTGAFGNGVSAWSCGVDTVSDTEKDAGS